MVPLKPNVFSIIMDQFPFVIQSIVGALNQGQDPQIIQLPTPTVQHCLIVRGWDASLRESKSVTQGSLLFTDGSPCGA